MSEEAVDAEAVEEVEPTLDETVAAAAGKAGLEQLDPRDIAQADIYKPSGAELVVAPGRDIYKVMDRADEIQILDELQGRPISEMVYSFPGDGGKKVTDLSYGGVREVVRTTNRNRFTAIRTSPDHPPSREELKEDGVDYYVVQVYAADLATGSGQWGVAIEPKRMKLTDGTATKWRSKGKGDQIAEDGTVWDKFALTKAVNKAQRNAMKALLPLEFVEIIKAQFLGDKKKVREIQAGPGAEQLAELPPPLDDERSHELRDEARAVYAEIKKIDRMKILPAAFNRMMSRNEWDHTRLEEFIEHLRETLDEVLRQQLEDQRGSA